LGRIRDGTSELIIDFINSPSEPCSKWRTFRPRFDKINIAPFRS
jgi:hypothetical protein